MAPRPLMFEICSNDISELKVCMATSQSISMPAQNQGLFLAPGDLGLAPRLCRLAEEVPAKRQPANNKQGIKGYDIGIMENDMETTTTL